MIDIDELVEEFQEHYPVEGIVGISKVGLHDPKAPEHEHDMECIILYLHRKNKIKHPTMYRGFKIFAKIVGKFKPAKAA